MTTLLSAHESDLKSQIRLELLEAVRLWGDMRFVRKTLSHRREERLRERYHDLNLAEPLFMEVVSPQVDWLSCRPEFQWVSDRRERLIWDYARNLVGSMPENRLIGRQLRFYFTDENTGRWLGIGCVSSALTNPSPRHKLMGQLDFKTQLNKVLNLSVCVPIQPFGLLCGGKLMFISTLSDEVRTYYEGLYGDPLLAIETTSLYGKSSQYNRIKEFKYLGLTAGKTLSHIGKGLMGRIHELGRIDDEYSSSAGSDPRARLVSHVARKVGLRTSDVLMTNHKRGYYWGVTAENSEAILKGEDESEPRYYDRPLQDLIDWWRGRWYEMRLPKKIEEAEAFDPVEAYALDNNVPEEYRQPRQMFLF